MKKSSASHRAAFLFCPAINVDKPILISPYFCRMNRAVTISFLLFLPTLVQAQLKYSKLVIEPKKIYDFNDADILVADTLVLKDSSAIKLNYVKDNNYIHAKVIKAGAGCRIIGRGEDGKKGKDGGNGYGVEGPCKDGTVGRNGARGGDGTNGNNLFLYFSKLEITGSLSIDLSGGNAGDGGNGGHGGGGSPGTKLCTGGNGGRGGNGAPGGNGGNSGNLVLNCPQCSDLRLILGKQLMVRTFGGTAGLGGEGGSGGLAGILSNGTSEYDGKPGDPGKHGADGIPGKNGAITFQ